MASGFQEIRKCSGFGFANRFDRHVFSESYFLQPVFEFGLVPKVEEILVRLALNPKP